MKTNDAIAILQDLVKIDTTNEYATEYEAALYIEDVLERAGIASKIIYSPNGRANLIAHLEAVQPIKEPLVLLSHLDVVAADRDTWSFPPFAGEEAEGCIWGRGTLDTKQLTVMHLIAFLELYHSEQTLNRDVYFVASADEENGSKEGMEYLAETCPEIFDNATVLSEGGGFTVAGSDGKPYMLFASGEKGTAVIKIVGTGDSGHAGSPPDNQAIAHITQALQYLLQQEPHCHEYSVLTTYTETFQQLLKSNTQPTPDDQLVAKLYEYMKFQTTMIDYLEIGTQVNVIPYKGEVTFEFRTLPSVNKDAFEKYMNQLFENSNVSWELIDFQQGYLSEVDAEVMKLFQQYSPDYGFSGTWVPFTALGKTDGRFIGKIAKNVYGLSPVTVPFSEVLKRVHSADERIETDAFVYGVNLMRKVVHHYCLQMEV